MNMEGFEKTIDITQGFKEISYCNIPMVDSKILQGRESHFYYNLMSMAENDVMNRL
jgi:hypothetical protein